MPTPFVTVTWALGDENYVDTANANWNEFKNKAVHVDDIPGYVAGGGDPATIAVTQLKNGKAGAPQLAEFEVPGRARGNAANSVLGAINVRQAYHYARIMAFQDSMF